MELAGKVFAQAPTGNKALKKNMVTGMKNGTVLEYTPGSPITALSLAPAE
jgi:antitoxin component YwqK of YwqJK toxin-antitoxin module